MINTSDYIAHFMTWSRSRRNYNVIGNLHQKICGLSCVIKTHLMTIMFLKLKGNLIIEHGPVSRSLPNGIPTLCLFLL